MVKKKPPEPKHEEHADETWLIPYSDLLTLLLALFIVLFASSSLDKDKAAQIQYALAAAFNALGADQLSGTVLNFMDEAKGLDLGEDVKIGADSKGATLEITSINLFDAGSTNIKPEILPTLKKIANLLSAPKYKRFRIIVEGHTDDTKEADPRLFPSNWELSGARAGSVVRTLINSGVADKRFQAVGMASIAPAYPNYNAYNEPIPENRLRNRRVVIRIEF